MTAEPAPPSEPHPAEVAEALLLAAERGDTAGRTAFGILRRGLAASPEIWRGMGVTLLLALLGGAGRVVIPVLIQQLLDRGLDAGLLELALGALVIVGAAALTRSTQRRLAAASEATLCGLRARAFAHVLRLSIAHHSSDFRGKLVSRVTSDVQALSTFLQWGGVACVVNGMIMAAALVAMAVYDWRLTLMTLALVVPLGWLIRRLQRRLGLAHFRVRSRISELFTLVSESAQAAAVVRAYAIEERTNQRALGAIGRWRDDSIRVGLLGSVLFSTGELFAPVIITGVVLAGAALGPARGLSVGTLVAFVVLVVIFLDPVTELTEVVNHMQSAVAGWSKVLDLLDLPIDVVDPDPGIALPPSPPTIAVERVSYGYRSDVPPALAEVSFVVAAGQRVAVVGPTGSGKTTLAKLIARLADPTAGRILVNGIDLREVAPRSLRSRLVMVPQDGLLFDTTLAANIAFGRLGASESEIRRALTELGLAGWIAGLPQGLATRAGQRGESLSMGERQLVALVRAYIADPACLILDEATSSVDPATDVRLTHALARLCAGRTTITIAHRLATAEQADEILVLDHGRLIERGTHRELLARGRMYAELHASWIRHTASTAAAAVVAGG